MTDSMSRSRRRFLKVSASTAASVALPALSLTKGAAATADMTVDLRDINGVSVFSRTLQPKS
jgi:hypothetical protein